MVYLWYNRVVNAFTFFTPFFWQNVAAQCGYVCEAALARTLRQATLGGHGGIGNGHPARWTWWEFETSNNTGFSLKNAPKSCGFENHVYFVDDFYFCDVQGSLTLLDESHLGVLD